MEPQQIIMKEGEHQSARIAKNMAKNAAQAAAGQVQNALIAPMQEMMGMDPWGDSRRTITIEQKFNLGSILELLAGCEAKNMYDIKNTASPMFVNEESAFCERCWCGPGRSLKWHVHRGTDKEAPERLTIEKPFNLPCPMFCCDICRPKAVVKDEKGQKMGRVYDTWSCCVINSRIYDADDTLKYRMSGSICQCGILCCPCLCEAKFPLYTAEGDVPVGDITKKAKGLAEMCLDMNNFEVTFPEDAKPVDKDLILGAAMILDMQYFEKQQ